MAAEEEPKFVVKDRRRFDMAGNERGEEGEVAREKSPSAGPALTSKAASVQASAESQPRGGASGHGSGLRQPVLSASESAEVAAEFGGENEITFSSFIISLATQVLMQLGEIKPPDEMAIPVDREGARHTIDILSMLQQKTRGNASAEEAKLMEEILHNLRMSYLRGAKRASLSTT